MPTRVNRRNDTDRVGFNTVSGNAYCIHGICLTTRLKPVRNRMLEAFITGIANPFHPDAVEELLIVDDCSSICGSIPSSKICFYSSIWNLADFGLRHGTDLRSICRYLRNLATSSKHGLSSQITYLKINLLPEAIQTPACADHTDTKLNPAITQHVLDTLGEEGILEQDAKIALTILLNSCAIRSNNLREGGPLFFYGADRRHIVSKILNQITLLRESNRG